MIPTVINWLENNKLPSGAYREVGMVMGEWPDDLATALDGLIPAEVEEIITVPKFFSGQYRCMIECRRNTQAYSYDRQRHYVNSTVSDDADWVPVVVGPGYTYIQPFVEPA